MVAVGAMLALCACHRLVPGVLCPAPVVVRRTVRVRVPEPVPRPASKPLTPAEREKASRHAAQLQHAADRLDARLHAILKGHRR